MTLTIAEMVPSQGQFLAAAGRIGGSSPADRQREPPQMSPRRRFNGMKRSRKILVAVVAGGSTLAIASAAFAFWTGGGSGTGAATASTPSALVVNQTNAAITNLFPGGPAQALSGTFNNSNSG